MDMSEEWINLVALTTLEKIHIPLARKDQIHQYLGKDGAL